MSDFAKEPAPDATGKCGELVTVRWEVFTRDNWHSDHPQSWAVRKREGRKVRELVDRSQAVELLARKDREVEAAMVIYRAERKWRSELEADNAAKAARINELSGLIDGENCVDPDRIDALFRRAEKTEERIKKMTDALCNVVLIDDVGHYVNEVVAEHIEALEAKLAAAEKALEPFALISSEGVIKQETGHVTVITCAEYFHKARAARGGKPS